MCIRDSIWPWFAIGALALIYFPGLSDSEMAYPTMAERFLPTGGAGLMMVAFWAAFMSTVDSRLNWGASYFVNDVYGQFGRDRDGRTARYVEAGVVLALAVSALMIAQTPMVISLAGIYKYHLIIQSGAALAAIARWYWWRMSIWAEICAFGLSIPIGHFFTTQLDISTSSGFATAFALNILLCGLATIAPALLTSRPVPTKACAQFHELTRVPGPGWRKVR